MPPWGACHALQLGAYKTRTNGPVLSRRHLLCSRSWYFLKTTCRSGLVHFAFCAFQDGHQTLWHLLCSQVGLCNSHRLECSSPLPLALVLHVCFCPRNLWATNGSDSSVRSTRAHNEHTRRRRFGCLCFALSKHPSYLMFPRSRQLCVYAWKLYGQVIAVLTFVILCSDSPVVYIYIETRVWTASFLHSSL